MRELWSQDGAAILELSVWGSRSVLGCGMLGLRFRALSAVKLEESF